VAEREEIDATVEDHWRDVASELTASWQAIGIDHSLFELDATGTLVPGYWDEDAADDTVTEAEIADLGFDLDRTEDKLLLGRVLGEGGAGVVRVADQPALAREVAVKILTAGDDERSSRRKLLREARVTGALEHPNIVPVHDIGRDATGRPMIVMKRIEGTAWLRLLPGDDAPVRGAAELERHLRVLVQVARAVDFAHTKGVLHRDLKPENVMIGAFAEVYVVDWGIATALPVCAVPGLPSATDVKDVFGTPGYMAPEMARADGSAISARTDVYLLGAVLHRLLTGRPPHRADTLVRSLCLAYESKPHEYDDQVPEGLATIARHAMARRPAERFAGAGAFADAVEDFLHHRDSRTLSDEGHRLLAFLLDAEAGEGDVAERYRECRFAFEQALRIWEENDDAKRGLTQAAERVIELELAAGRPDAARAVLDDVPEARPELVARVEEAVADQRDKSRKLERIARDEDLSAGDAARARAAALLSLGSAAVNFICGALDRSGVTIEHMQYALAHALNLLWGVAIIWWLRRHIMSNTANRRMSLTAVVTIAGYIALMLLSYQLDVPFGVAIVFVPFLMGAIWLVGALAFDWRTLMLPIVAVIEIPLLLRLPYWKFEIVGGAIVVGLIGSALLWRFASETAHGGDAR
jgi:serine/threonine-protein kinase